VDLGTFCVVPRPIAGSGVLLVHCGRLSAEKKPQRSLNTLASLRAGGRAASLVVAGDGFVPDRAELAALLARADVVLAPGPAETFGLAALACGTRTPGVRTAPGGGWRGWAALLAATLDQPDLRNLATLGALASDVERFQRPAALAVKPDVASVIVGINDTLRGDFDPERTGAAVDRTVAALRATGAEVLTVRLPDPGQMFGLPGALARPLARRMRAVNTVVDQVALRYRTIHLDAARDPATCAGRPGREGMASRRRRSSRDSCADRAIRRRLGVRRARGRYGDPSTGGRSRRGP
jgi:glycosyltransferase involved in cell wall biosynthesis